MKDVSMKKNIYYIGELDFSKGTAMSARVLYNMASIAENNNYYLSLIGIGGLSKQSVRGLEVNNINVGRNSFQKLIYYLFRGILFCQLLKRFHVKNDIVIYYGTSSLILIPLRFYCKKHNVKLIVDVVEWYNYSHLPLGKYGPIALNTHYAMTTLIPKCDGVIVISSYLDKYFTDKGLKVFRVPVLIDSQSVVNKGSMVACEGSINLIYAGSPGKKDLIINMIRAVEIVTKSNNRIIFNILGIDKVSLERLFGMNLSDNIKCHGILEQKKVYEFLSRSDFSVLLRPNERYANAGFPTKFVESLTYRVPVIANLTSDLPLYLVNGFNGFVVENESVNSLVQVLENILCIEEDKLTELKDNSRRTAVDNFDYRLYSKGFNDFFASF